MNTKILHLLIALTLPARLLGDSVTVTITVDNGYGFGFGDQNGIYAGQYYGGVDNCTAGQIFGSPCYVFVPPDGTVTDTGPEIYNITAGSSDYIYIVAWSDDQIYQGTIASFTDNTTGTTVTTSPAWPWQVFATGTNWAPNCGGGTNHGPPLTGFSYAINNQIAVANANGGAPGATSVGWVGANGVTNGSLYFGGYGNSYNNFNYPHSVPACIASGSTWMEYDPEPTNVNCNPFAWGSVNDYTNANFLREYLIYRIGPLSELTSSNTCTSSNGCLSLSVPTNIVVYSCSNCVQEFYTPTATDKCCQETLTVTCNPPSGTCFYPGTTTTVTCTATDDGCGNSVSCSFTVTVICTNCLQVVCPTNKTVQCGSVWTFDQPVASSCCTTEIITSNGLAANVIITSTGIVTNGACPQVAVTQTWLIADGCGDSNTCSQTVTVLGCCSNNCLQVQCPTNKTVQCGSAWTFDPPTATTCCTSNVPGTATNLIITSTGTLTNGVCPQVITNSWLITDGCGDSNTCSQTVTVVDTTPPVITCPTNTVFVALNKNCQLVIPGIQVTATDNCTPLCSLVYSQSPPAGTTNLSGNSAVVTVTVTDLCGNSNSCSVLVVGEDKTGPVVTCPATMTVTNCLVPCVPVTATNCGCLQSSLTITQSPPCGTPLGPGINSITVTVTDCHGNATVKVVHLVVAGAESFLANLFNTGVDASYALLADDTVDPHYALPPAAVPAGMPGDYFGNAVAVSDICHASGIPSCAYHFGSCYYWTPWSLPPDPAFHPAVSKWIAPDYTNNGCCPYGGYTYALTFNLPASFNPATATISGRWAADNEAFMYLNTKPVPVIDGGATINGNGGFAQWTYFTIPAGSGFVSGPNTLTFNVINTDNDSWTGLRVEFTNAFASCSTCAPPVINWITPAQSLQAGSTATFNVSAGGTPPLSYQWSHNNLSLAGDTNSTLQVHSIGYSDAGLYSIVISNPCGVMTGYVRLNVTQPWWWQWGWWNVQVLTNPLAATVGPDLNLSGSTVATNYAISTGTTEDFGLPEEGGQIVNVMDINPQAAASIQLPLITAPGSNSDDSYTVIMDIYEPDTSLGTPSTLFQSISCCVSNLGSSGQDGVALTLDETNNLHITGSASGVPFDAASTTPLQVDAWNRVALVVNNPQDGGTATLNGFINGQNVVVIQPCICCVVHFVASTINWGVSPPTLFSVQTNAVAPNGEFYVSSIQFHDIALSSDMIAGIGSPDNGPAPANVTSAGSPPVLSATMSNGAINITWSGSPYVLQETTDLTSGDWIDSALSFTETGGTTGNIVTTAVVTPAPSAPSKFYRLIFSP